MILKKTDDINNNADVTNGGMYSDMWDKYALSYKIGAETIAQKIKTDNSDIDYLVYPLIFLYRHYFELRIKGILKLNKDLNTNEIKVPSNHQLTDIWQRCVERIRLIRPDTDLTLLKKVENTLIGFDNHDAKSFAFRYPEDKNGKPSLKSLEYVDVRLFLTSIDDSVSFLEEFKSLWSATIDFKDPI